MFKKNSLFKIVIGSEKLTEEEEEMIAYYKPYNELEESIVEMLTDVLGLLLSAKDVSKILELGKNIAYEYDHLCPFRKFKPKSSRKLFLVDSIIIIAREQEKKLDMDKIIDILKEEGKWR